MKKKVSNPVSPSKQKMQSIEDQLAYEFGPTRCGWDGWYMTGAIKSIFPSRRAPFGRQIVMS